MKNAAYTNDSFINDEGKSQIKQYDKQRAVELSTKSSNGFQESEDYDPYAHRKVQHPLTNTETIIHLLKSALGTGIFAVPNAFNHAGYVVGFIGTVVLGSIATYCVHMIVNMHYDLCKWKKTRWKKTTQYLTTCFVLIVCFSFTFVVGAEYELSAEAAVLSGPKCLHRFAPYMIHVVNAFLLAYQIGACCIYVVFIATNLRALLMAFDIIIDVRLLMVIILLPLILINWVRKLKYLAPLSTLGNVITIASFGIICYYIFREPLTLEGKRACAMLAEFPMFFGTVLFALEAIGVIMPLENEMKTPRDFRGPTGILNRAMVMIVSLYIGLGLAGYMKYGSNVEPTVTVNLPEHELVAQLAKGMIACGVFTTHAIACYVSIDIAWTQYVNKKVEKSPHKLLWEYVLRTSIVFLTFIMAVAIPNLDLFISLVGALSLSALGILFPAFLECLARWHTTSGVSKAFMIFKNVIIGCIGLAGFTIGTTLSIKDIIKTYLD